VALDSRFRGNDPIADFRKIIIGRTLPVEPDVFEAPAIVLAVGHHRQPFDFGLPAGRGTQVVNDRPGQVFLQLMVDLPMKPRIAVERFGMIVYSMPSR
jgi:hypothetical protein